MSGAETALSAMSGAICLAGIFLLPAVMAGRDRGKAGALGPFWWAGVFLAAWIVGSLIAVGVALLLAKSMDLDRERAALALGVLGVGLPLGMYGIAAALFSPSGDAPAAEGTAEPGGHGPTDAMPHGVHDGHEQPGLDLTDPDPFTPEPLDAMHRHNRLDELATVLRRSLPTLSSAERRRLQEQWRLLTGARSADEFDARADELEEAVRRTTP